MTAGDELPGEQIKLIDEIIGRLRKGWTKVALARDGYGDQCDPMSSYARSWCLVGAVFAVRGFDTSGIPALYDRIRAVGKCKSMIGLNDKAASLEDIEEVLFKVREQYTQMLQ